MVVSGYTMELYCDSGRMQPLNTPGHQGYIHSAHVGTTTGMMPDEFHGSSEADCRRQARAKGWLFGTTNAGTTIVVCPACAAAGETINRVRRLLATEA